MDFLYCLKNICLCSKPNHMKRISTVLCSRECNIYTLCQIILSQLQLCPVQDTPIDHITSLLSIKFIKKKKKKNPSPFIHKLISDKDWIEDLHS